MLFALILVIVGIALMFIGVWNYFMRKKNQVYNVSASLDAILKKRYDLIPNLVQVVKGYAAYEQTVLESILSIRNEGERARTIPEKGLADVKAVKGINQLFAVAERYPDLKADKEFRFLQASLNEVEEQISAARRAYNASVQEINTAVAVFPLNLFAKLYKVTAFPFFALSDSERKVPLF
jgi:LemA protein